MRAICYISNFAQHLDRNIIDDLITSVNKNNKRHNITGILIIRNKHFFQILEGERSSVENLYAKIKVDSRHTGVIKLLDTTIDDRIFDDYNSGEFEVFQKFADLKKLYLYFKWIKNAEYIPADGLIELTTNFLKQNS
ncbi:BLUF domain-containing protein [Psychroserpens sp.]|uniref:BLUF domain-containing protein n=1 Tax=Psychroserpens sp. TaxID=2020870 RepID=UPI001B22956D|nr:BLUF domain-containing protein [Psychroserpens sp.]MBO6605879.1 BLUF domain-containing protein [Psychroserpens sp.]MBO6632344.1 BLUF domain-containing protein [Psychroserpens sp.]MBO6652750.1 BLUF domain-containing protein [Psychroserpens sp.]MBO6681478.1 BLUF domain-containing protein [Psychroserpens sp.]MBO6749253.1 BLUF domain-containing protein [Psychroserpens sp.]